MRAALRHDKKEYLMTETMTTIMANAQSIAVVGFSSKPHKAGYYVPAYLQ